ncbi:hypothetical protein PP914_gp122 [Arthrobacter phage Qui]|jgi:hypothetical protein|uniref:Uncharacterized protein n=1 Tax=Arthrobacter phage Qui TaxID=2603260 RepID=A0A5B8WH35_9CAUD|nr:hypothetical protein PP914_gp122 [Arthrobacter phage Qui]QED11611.1 hypothetical protein SEA_QUI_122 [Arthrobacter phage Qui]QOC56443.1 hypothetical protein SEA_PAELLA_122 [Arthrobacter phage Paella]
MTSVTPEEAQAYLTKVVEKAHTSGVSDGFTLAIECLESILTEAGLTQRIGLALGISALKQAKNIVDHEGTN